MLQNSLPPPLEARKGAPLLYAIQLSADLSVEVDPRNPVRGQSAFETDLSIFERRENAATPRVVAEFKTNLTTHDVITYSAKARKHKQVYPYLRYGLVMEGTCIPGRAFTHNEALDFMFCLDGRQEDTFDRLIALLSLEVQTSKRLQELSTSSSNVRMFRISVEASE
jgi:hypothetical protein